MVILHQECTKPNVYGYHGRKWNVQVTMATTVSAIYVAICGCKIKLGWWFPSYMFKIV